MPKPAASPPIGTLAPAGLTPQETETLRAELLTLLQNAYYKRSPALCLCRDFLVALIKDSNGLFDAFLAPIEPHLLPSYRARVRRKMDLSIIARRLGDGEYDSSRRDLLMVARNAFLYSQPNSPFHESAAQLKQRLETLREKARHIGPGNGYEVSEAGQSAVAAALSKKDMQPTSAIAFPGLAHAHVNSGIKKGVNMLSPEQFKNMTGIPVQNNVRETMMSLQQSAGGIRTVEKRPFEGGAFQSVEKNGDNKRVKGSEAPLMTSMGGFPMMAVSSQAGTQFMPMHAQSFGRMPVPGAGPGSMYHLAFPGHPQMAFRSANNFGQQVGSGTQAGATVSHVPTSSALSQPSGVSHIESVESASAASLIGTAVNGHDNQEPALTDLTAEKEAATGFMHRLLQKVKTLCKEAKITPQEKLKAKELVLSKDERVLSSFRLFESDQDEDDFIETLQMITAASASGSAHSPTVQCSPSTTKSQVSQNSSQVPVIPQPSLLEHHEDESTQRGTVSAGAVSSYSLEPSPEALAAGSNSTPVSA